MLNYIDQLHPEIQAYFKILAPEFPKWLLEYIHTPAMKRLAGISMNCGTDYSKLFNINYFYSTLDHSIGVALIIWHFTHDKKQTLAGLFHDIATPAFKHCIDFMNDDALKQESTEAMTSDIIKNSSEIMTLLNRDQIKLSEVDNYHLYPIADNDTPRLSADRFEYTFSSGLAFLRIWDLNMIEQIYNNIIIIKNEENQDELAFMDWKLSEHYIQSSVELWKTWISDEDRTVMQFIADIVKSMINSQYLTIDDLYSLSEIEIIDRILNCPDQYLKESFRNFLHTTSIIKSNQPIQDKYCISVVAKKRYITPLCIYHAQTLRIDKISPKTATLIKNYLNTKSTRYTGFNFPFQPYKELAK